MNIRRLAFLLFLGLLALAPHASLAANCASPTGSEGQVRYDSTAKAMYFCNGTEWELIRSGNKANVPTIVKATTATHNGNFGGYSAMFSWIEANGCSGYKVCSMYEIIAARGYVNTQEASVTAWVIDDLNNDCSGGWNNSTATYSGTTVTTNGSKSQVSSGTATCDTALKVWCCKY